MFRLHSLRIWSFALSLCLLACGARAADRLVVLISLDGLASYYLDDPAAHMPTIRRLVREGASAGRMKCALPTVTWPNHTTLATGVMPGRHGVIGNTYWDRKENKTVALIPDPLFDKDEIVKVPTIYDVAHNAGLKTAGICWPASRNAKTLDWTVPDIFPDTLFQKCSTPQLLDELHAEHIPFEMQETWCKAPGGGVQRDWMYARMTELVIRKHRPNLLLLHLMETDHVQHAKGPKTPDAYWACSHEDDRVRDVLEACGKEFPGRATIFVTSDHGFIPFTREIRPNVVLRKAGLLTVEGGKITTRRATALAQGGSTFIYVLDREHRAEILKQLPELFGHTEGLDSIIELKDFAKHGLVSPDQDARMADLVLTCNEGFNFSDAATGEEVVTKPSDTVKGSHGYSPTQPMMYATFVAWGAGIKPGVKLPEVNNVDVSPTIARLLGLKMKNVDGRVLEEILAK